MTMARRRLLHLLTSATAVTLSGLARLGQAKAQPAQGTLKLTPLLKADLEGQNRQVEETVVNILEMGAGAAAPWHMHPGAQEIIFVLDGALSVEAEGQETRELKLGEITLIPAEIAHLVRNEGSAIARALVTHSRADKNKPFLVTLQRSR